jgi:hypothetical protein
MDSTRFDAVLARLAREPNRRQALHALLGGTLVISGLTSIADDASAMKRRRRRRRKTKRTICHCPSGNRTNCQNLLLGGKAAR